MSHAKTDPPANHVMVLIHGPEERAEFYFNVARRSDFVVQISNLVSGYFPNWKPKEGSGALRFKCRNFGLDDEVRLLDALDEVGFELVSNTTNNHQTKLIFKRAFLLDSSLHCPTKLYKTTSHRNIDPEH